MSGFEKVFPDAESALLVGIPAAFAARGRVGVTAGPDVPADSELATKAVKGFVRVHLVDDPDDRFTRNAIIDIDCFATTRAVAYAVAQEIRAILLSSRTLGGMVLDLVSTNSGPKRVPWDNSNIRRYLATYEIRTRR